MSKKCYRFFGGLLNTQEKWLNKMSEKGYRLVRTGKLLYEFEKCKPDEVTYCVEFIGEKSKEGGADKILDYADRPSFCLYSSGLSPPRDILIRFSRYQTI